MALIKACQEVENNIHFEKTSSNLIMLQSMKNIISSQGRLKVKGITFYFFILTRTPVFIMPCHFQLFLTLLPVTKNFKK